MGDDCSRSREILRDRSVAGRWEDDEVNGSSSAEQPTESMLELGTSIATGAMVDDNMVKWNLASTVRRQIWEVVCLVAVVV